MKEFKIAKVWIISFYIIAPLVLVLAGWLIYQGIGNWMGWFLIPTALLPLGLLIFSMLEIIKGKVVIDEDKISVTGAFSSRELKVNEIKGYRIDANYIYIVPDTAGIKVMKIITYYEIKEIVQWLASKYPNIDVVKFDQEQQEILGSEEYGRTSEARADKLKIATRTAMILNRSGFIVAGWTIFWPVPYDCAVAASGIIPVISIIALKLSNGLIRINEQKFSAYPSVFIAVLLSTAGLFVRSLLDFNIFDYSNVWIPSILITAVFLAIIVHGNKEFDFKKVKTYLMISGFALVTFGYGYGSVITFNCCYDKSKPEIFNATILSKRISSGKSTTYYLKLTPWGKRTEASDVTVSSKLYNQLDENREVTIYFKKGVLGIPWFCVTPNEQNKVSIR